MLIYIKSFSVAIIRALTLLAKFIFTVYLARVLSIEDFGIWILVVAGIGYGVFIIGAELFNITLRNYIKNSKTKKIGGISIQWTYFLALYLVLLLISLLIESVNGAIYSGFLLLSTFILIFEHSTQEIHRIAIYSNDQIHANMILFIKSAGWMMPMVFHTFKEAEGLTIQMVMQGWFYGATIALVYGIYFYWDLFKSLHVRISIPNVKKISSYVKMLMPFWILALAIRTPLVLDRYLLELFSDRENLSVYGYCMTFGNGVQAMFDAIILSRLIPQLLQKDNEIKPSNLKILIGRHIIIAIIFWLLSLISLYLLMPYFNAATNKNSMSYTNVLFVVIGLGQMIFSIGVLIQYGLYALRRDQDLTKGAISYLIANIALMFILIPKLGSIGAALSLGIAASIFLLIRFVQLRKV